MEYAMEADPGRLTASFPTFDSLEEADRSASYLNARTPHLPPVRILVRHDCRPGGAWELVTR